MLSDYVNKIKLVLPYYLLTTFVAVTIPLGVRWLTESLLAVDMFDLDTWQMWLPILFSLLCVFLLLRPRLALMTFKQANGRLLFQLIAAIAIALPNIFIQHLYTTAVYDLVHLTKVEAFADAPTSRFYQLAKVNISPIRRGTYVDVRTTGDKSHDIKVTIFTAIPFVISENKPTNTNVYWFSLVRDKRIDGKLSKADKEREYQEFIQHVRSELNDLDLNHITYFEKIGKSSERRFLVKAVARSLGFQPENDLVMLSPKFSPFADRNGEKLDWARSSYLIGSLLFIFALWFPKMTPESIKTYQMGRHELDHSLMDFVQLFIPTKEHFIIPIIITINVLVYIVMCFSGIDAINPNAAELLEWGANKRSDTTGGEWWRLVSSTFLHGGVMHLMLNMYGLLIASIYIEPIFGKWRTALLYLASGIGGSLGSIYWHENTTSVGASGALFGLFAAILVLLPTRVFIKEARLPIFLLFGAYVGISLIMGLNDGIDNAAHIGGMLAGAITALLYFAAFKFRNKS